MIDYDHISLITEAGSIELEVKRPSERDPFVYKAIEGMGPPPIDVQTHESTAPGNLTLGTHPQGRELVITVGLNPWPKHNGSYAELRGELYSLISGTSDSLVQFAFMKHGQQWPIAWTNGTVSNIEAIINGPNPEAQITLKCESPYFQMSELEDYVIGDFTYRNNTTLATHDYTIQLDRRGMAPVGIDVRAYLQSDASKFEIFTDNVKNGWLRIENAPLKGGSLPVIVTTNVGDRRVIQGDTSLMHRLSARSSWITLPSRLNTLTVRSQSKLTGLTLLTRKMLWGI